MQTIIYVLGCAFISMAFLYFRSKRVNDRLYDKLEDFIRQRDNLRSENYNISSTNTVMEKLLEDNKDVLASQQNVIMSQRSEIATNITGIERLKEKASRIESQKKSSEVKLGLMAENFMPFIRDYPYDHKRFRFLANPVDGIQVTDDAVIFVEFKTGGARLSKSQKFIKDLVTQGKVRFETFRVNEEGSHLKLEANMEDLDGYSKEAVG